MDLWYSEAATALAEYINGCGFPFDRTLPLRDQYWWDTLSSAAFNLIQDRFERNQLATKLEPLQMDWIVRRARSRGSSVRNMTHQEMVIYDIVDVLPYYNLPSRDNPPLGYRIPEAFSL